MQVELARYRLLLLHQLAYQHHFSSEIGGYNQYLQRQIGRLATYPI
jgi:hypothetical protein